MQSRRDPRFALGRPALLRSEARVWRGLIENLSRRGAMLALEGEGGDGPGPSVGTRGRLRFELPGWATPIEVSATVRWRSTVVPGLCGVELDAALDPALMRLVELVSPGAGRPVRAG